MRTNLKDYLNGEDPNLNNPDFDDGDLFFDEEYHGKFNNDKLLQLEYKQERQERKRKLWICMVAFGIAMGVLMVLFCFCFYFNLYGFQDNVVEFSKWIIKHIH